MSGSFHFGIFVFSHFGHFNCVIFFRFFPSCLENVNKDYVKFSYFYNFIDKSDQKPKTQNGMNETLKEKTSVSQRLIFTEFLQKQFFCFLNKTLILERKTHLTVTIITS